MKCFTSWKEFASASATVATPSERPIDVRSWTGLGHLDDTSTLSLTVPEETAVDIASWLRSLGLERYEATFRENDVDAELLRHAYGRRPQGTRHHLDRSSPSPSGGDRRFALRRHTRLMNPFDSSTRYNPTENLGPSETIAERRPLSVMFCDLIGSTALSSRLDPRICGRSSAPIRRASPPPSNSSTASLRVTLVTGC